MCLCVCVRARACVCDNGVPQHLNTQKARWKDETRRIKEDVEKVETNMKEMILFNDAYNTFYLLLYGVWHMVNDPTTLTWSN